MESLLSVEDFSVDLRGTGPPVSLLEEIDLSCPAGGAVALVGESGSGKTLLARSILGLLPPRARIRSGRIRFGGEDLTRIGERGMNAVRGRRIGMVFQDPSAALDPVQTAEGALREALRLPRRAEARRRARALLEEVGLPGPRILGEYPHRLSGGMRQRLMIAVALAGDPALLLADEPTASLDRPLETGILDLLDRLRRERGLGLIVITHDLRVAAGRAERIAVMYSGRIVEEGPAAGVFDRPAHPYTAALRACLGRRASGVPPRLPAIPGAAPPPGDRPGGSCAFAPRCPEAFDRCRAESPVFFAAGPSRVRCFLRAAG